MFVFNLKLKLKHNFVLLSISFISKPHFKEPIMQKTLGSPAAQEVLTHIKPKYWFSAHLHCKYPAVIKHRVCVDNFLSWCYIVITSVYTSTKWKMLFK